MTLAPMNPDPRIPHKGIVPAPLNLRESWKHLRAAMVCVDYADILAITLPRNLKHFAKVLIVTTPRDTETLRLADAYQCVTYPTEAFYERGAKFNKWLALERALEMTGWNECNPTRPDDGWLCLMDADVIWPTRLPEFHVPFGSLCSPLRHMGPMPKKGEPYPANRMSLDPITREDIVPQESIWSAFPIHRKIGRAHV